MDTVANFLNALITAQRVGKKRVAVPYSALTESMARFLQEKGKIAKLRMQEGPHPKLVITLQYHDKEPAMHGVRRLSKSGQRRYAGKTAIPYSRDGVGFVIVSTSRGLMDDTTARKQGVGGELMCEIW